MNYKLIDVFSLQYFRILKTCGVCQEQFTLVEFISHKKLHPEPLQSQEGVDQETIVVSEHSLEDLNCTICGETFPKESLLRIHQVRSHSLSLVACLSKVTLPANCHVRRKLFGSGPSENAKRDQNQNLKRFKCRYCEKSFVLLSQCKSHENAHVENPISVRPAVESSVNQVQCQVKSIITIDFPASESYSSEFESSSNSEGDQSEIPNGDHSLCSEELTLETETAEIGSDYEEMDTTNSCGTPTTHTGHTTLEMPKLVAPTQIHHLSNFTNFQGGQNRAQSISCVVTSITSFSAQANSAPEEDDRFDPSTVNGIIKQEAHMQIGGFTSTTVLTNGDIFPREW